jgi:Caspase domain
VGRGAYHAGSMRVGAPVARLCLCALALISSTEAQKSRDLSYETDSASRSAAEAQAPAIANLPPVGKRWALIVGVDQYEDKQITPLYAASNDATALADAFVRYAGFPKEQVIVLASNQPPERQPSRGNLLLRLANLARLVPNDGLLLFAFAGHGIERNNEAFLLPSDAKMSDNLRVLQATAISVREIKEWVQEMAVKQVLVLLDACRNDPTSGRGDAPNPMTESYRAGFDFEGRNSQVEAFATLYATRVGQRAYEYAEKKHGYFTWAIVEGLKGRAANERGEVTLAGLERFIQEAVPRQIGMDLGAGKDQRPFADVRGFRAGELILAKVDPVSSRHEQAAASAPDPRVVQLEEWERLRTSRDMEALAGFAARYPGGPFSEDAFRRIEFVEWENTESANSPESYEAFLAKYPNSVFAEVARAALARFAQSKTDLTMIMDVLKGYERAYGNRDGHGIGALWPSLGKRELDRIDGFFRIARQVELRLDALAPAQVEQDTAAIQCRRRLMFSDDRGQQKPVEDTVTIRLRRTGERWVIDSVR